jgi:glycosyltransferase involved in cell wall biosynthesis
VLGTLAAKSAGVPHVVRTVHGLSEALRGWKRAKLAAYEALDKATLWCFADCVIAVSNQMAATLRRSRCRPRAVTCIHNGINLQELRATRSPEDVRRALGIRADAVVIGSAGRFAPVKGHEYLIRAAPHVLAAEPRARFLFVGSGPLRGGLMALAKTLAVDQACVFHDPSLDDRAGVYDLIAAMDVFALPSLSEGVPLALLEAMALGRPAVATAVGGVPEVITDRATGLLVAPRDAPALAAACLEMVRNISRAHAWRARRRTVEGQFSHDRAAKPWSACIVTSRAPAALRSGSAWWRSCAHRFTFCSRVSGAGSRMPSSGGASVGCGRRPRRSRRRCDRPAAS